MTEMNKFAAISKMRIASVAIFIAALGIFLWRPAPLVLPAANAGTVLETSIHRGDAISLERAKAYFDLSFLPAKLMPSVAPQPVDPAAGLQRYQLLGVTVNQTGAVALVSDGAHPFNVKLGYVLEDFIVSNIEPRRVEFKKDDTVAILELPAVAK
jgi:hypothetical protein